MTGAQQTERFAEAARRAGAEVVTIAGATEAAAYIEERAAGPVVLPAFPSGERLELAKKLSATGLDVAAPGRQTAAQASAGISGANFALADTGTVVLESTTEEIRLTTTLPERHFVLLDPRKIVADALTAAPLVRRFHDGGAPSYLAYITGPSRTADIERVLTIGVHGPRELHILLIEGLSDDPLEI